MNHCEWAVENSVVQGQITHFQYTTLQIPTDAERTAWNQIKMLDGLSFIPQDTDLSRIPFQDQTTNDGSQITFRENKNIHENFTVDTNFLCISYECKKTADVRTAMKLISHGSADGHCRSMIRFKEWSILTIRKNSHSGQPCGNEHQNHFPLLKASFHDQQAQISCQWVTEPRKNDIPR